GRLAGADTGKGRLPEPEEIVAVARDLLDRPPGPPDLSGRRVVVSAGGTREYLDPVRFLGNRSSGRQGYALARAAAARGARVTVVAADVGRPEPAGADVVQVGSAAELRDAVVRAAADADAVVMAAAVADFRPRQPQRFKIKKAATGGAGPVVELEQTPDVLSELAATRGRPVQVPVGLCAEAG